MYHSIARTAKFILSPTNAMVLFALCGLLLRMGLGTSCAADGIILASPFLLAVFGLLPVGDWLLDGLQTRFPRFLPDGGPVSGIIVLGGVVSPFGPLESIRWAPTGAVARLFETVKLAEEFPDARVLVSAGPEYTKGGVSEADGIAQYLVTMGVAEGRMLLEHRSRDTSENARFSFALANPRPEDRWLLVTSAYHMPRAIGCFRQAGFNVAAAPAERQLRQRFSWWSAARNFSRLDLAAREHLGLLAYWILGKTSTFMAAP